MGEIFRPHAYQAYCINRIINDPAVGLFLEPGLGKTAITLFAVLDLKYHRFDVHKCLVIAPKKVAETTWTSEALKWEQLQPLRLSQVLGSERERLKALDSPADIYIINRENVQWLVSLYGRTWPFDMVVIDESSNFKNHRSKRFKSLKMVQPKISKMVELTGTPRPRSLMDLWSQVYLLDGGFRLGRTITAYRDTFFKPGRRNKNIIYEYEPLPGAEDCILSLISDICVSLRERDYLELPELVYHNIKVKMSAAAQKDYMRLEKETLLMVDDAVLTANTAAALSNKLLQLCNGAVYDEPGQAVFVHDCKIQAFVELLESLNGEHVIVCYNYRHDLSRLLEVVKAFPLRSAVYGGDKDAVAWNAGETDILFVQPMSCGYGLNLQAGGHHIIWFGLTFDAEVYLQMNKRLHRQGQTHPVIIHNLVVEGARDEDALQSVDYKTERQNYCLDSLKARIQQIKQEVSND